ncbi:MAG TPA: hypothetical protein VHU92_01705 [Streptosporangiaceae bacterium]|jgi:3-hydroxyisobutyrate dehydrogenase-like beta-hydroxyacid dehydrogenase|nr:hypothetical protein [Streptosporangiaceae bacterium]
MTTIASLGLGRMGAPVAEAAALALARVPDQSADLAVLVTKSLSH